MFINQLVDCTCKLHTGCPRLITCTTVVTRALNALLQRFGLVTQALSAQSAIPGSFWGEPEAGLVENTLYVRWDTPLHSALHEASHFICMDESRRRTLHTDALSDDLEECAVCYLQILLAQQMVGVGGAGIMEDMDEWGYSFRLGSTRAWFENDALEARQWLRDRNIIDEAGQLTGRRAD